ncbi:MerR family transcriptional regulator [Streptomyces sp. AC627_RSS907]|uniref:MerR family transcriptional regulator n=1 Tax=Streptomyces sp. AC627_RSS907 TaxID=2823684 RepID=UPI0020B76B8E|nr:MerR family transcriptional regulator [Streptomyces sp. AC627_RSS907]
MNIGSLATHVLRHREAVGLLTPVRDAAGRRRCRTARLARDAVILRAEEAGLSLDAIRSLVTTADAGKRRNTLREEAEALRSRVAAARAALDVVECALGRDREVSTRCAHVTAGGGRPHRRRKRCAVPCRSGRVPFDVMMCGTPPHDAATRTDEGNTWNSC